MARLVVPIITEAELLAFQYKHFGDESKPNNWFIDANIALNFWLEWRGEGCDDEDGGDGMRYYTDGTKRTLTDKQVGMFRHSEIQSLLRQRRLQIEGREKEQRACNHYGTEELEACDNTIRSSASQGSSIEGELVSDSDLARSRASLSKPPVGQRKPQSGHCETASSSNCRSSTTQRKRRHGEVPYDRRHKRQWEQYIEDNDPIEGSMTHRRIVRELDDQTAEEVDMDY
ncbi:MAG: hypothetical protein FE78DRAFT_79037 [Acidomyces sp. 'richmondensis']|nr:MAG: hypothetical protein FE78DRAFT_79037 [Acidomyces sp. 'richmondensis']